MARSSAQPYVQGCRVPGNQAMVCWGLGWDGRPIQVQIAACAARFRRVSCRSTSLDSSFLRHDRTHPADSPWQQGLDQRPGSSPQVSAFGSHVQNQSFPKRSLGKGCNPPSPHRSSHRGVVPAPRGLTHPFLKHLQSLKSNLILLPGADGE